MKTKTQEQNKLGALIRLIDDPDRAIYEQIKDEILKFHPNTAINDLQIAFNESFDGLQKSRLAELLDILKLRKLKEDIELWLQDDTDNLLKGLYHISEYGFPKFDRENISQTIQEMVMGIDVENKSSREIIHSMNQVILYDHGFNGELRNYNNLNNSFINKTFNNKKGNPIGLSIIYLLLAQKLNLPIVGINSPGHFLLGASDDLDKQINSILDVDFFIDPFNNGRIINKQEFIVWLKERDFPTDRNDLIANNRAIVKRVFNNLIYALYTKGEEKTAQHLLVLAETIN